MNGIAARKMCMAENLSRLPLGKRVGLVFQLRPLDGIYWQPVGIHEHGNHLIIAGCGDIETIEVVEKFEAAWGILRREYPGAIDFMIK